MGIPRHSTTCLHSLLTQTRLPDEILVVENASTDETHAVARQVPHVRVVAEPRKGLVIARETGRREAAGDLLVYLDANCRAPLTRLERVERRFGRDPTLVALSGLYRYYEGHWRGRLLIRAYDVTLAPKHLYSWKTLVGVEFEGQIDYGPYRVHRQATFRIRHGATEERIRVSGSMIENATLLAERRCLDPGATPHAVCLDEPGARRVTTIPSGVIAAR